MTAVMINRVLMKENLGRYHGDYGNALRAYDAGTDPSKWNNPETNDYARSLMAAGGWKSDSQRIRVTIEGETRIPAKDSNGKTVGHTQLKAVQKPVPSGSGGMSYAPWASTGPQMSYAP
jgi:hypothetical protein